VGLKCSIWWISISLSRKLLICLRVWAGGISTLFTYGQTGSGKTYTVNGITQQVVRDLMSMSESEEREFHVCCFELLGTKSFGTTPVKRLAPGLCVLTFAIFRFAQQQTPIQHPRRLFWFNPACRHPGTPPKLRG